jgi:hypothetical protein
MSGPIIRKYGFPNFEKIFGARPLEHGADEAERPMETKDTERSPAGQTENTKDREPERPSN